MPNVTTYQDDPATWTIGNHIQQFSLNFIADKETSLSFINKVKETYKDNWVCACRDDTNSDSKVLHHVEFECNSDDEYRELTKSLNEFAKKELGEFNFLMVADYMPRGGK